MTKTKKTTQKKTPEKTDYTYGSGCRSFVYLLGIIGAGVFFISQASGFWATVLALLKALVWPAFLIYYLFSFLV